MAPSRRRPDSDRDRETVRHDPSASRTGVAEGQGTRDRFSFATLEPNRGTALATHDIRVGQVSPGPVISALLADWPADRLQAAKDSGSLIEPSEVADAIHYMLTRPRNVTIRDMIVLRTNFDI